ALTHAYTHSFPTRRSSDLLTARWKNHLRFSERCQAANAWLKKMPASHETGIFICVVPSGLVDAALDCVFHITFDLLRFAFDFLRSEEHTSELQSRENLVCR